MPHERNPFFTGREQILEDLRAALTQANQAALSQVIRGLGGIGKTQTALEYAYRFRDSYKAVFWTGAEDTTALTAGFVDIARTLDLPEAKLPEQQYAVNAVRRWLEDNDGWLLIFDNANTPELIKSWRPRGSQGHTLLTSRAHTFDQLGISKPTKIAELSSEEALAFLLKRTGLGGDNDGEREAAAALAKELGYLPLALEQAGAYILELSASFRGYLDGYRKRRLELLERKQPVTGDYPETVATTWSLNFQQVEAASPAAADLLRASAFLSPDDIPFELISLGAAELGEALSAALAHASDDPLALPELLVPLQRYSLISGEGNVYSVHRLVQAVLQDRLEAGEKQDWQRRVIHAVNRAMPEPEFSNWQLCERLLPHALACSVTIAAYGEASHLWTAEAGSLLDHAGWYLTERVRYADAKPLFETALAIRKQALGTEHPDTALSLNNLAFLYDKQGRYGEALPLYERALAIREKALGPEHPDTARSLNNLAGLYRSQGLLAKSEALPLSERALAISEKALGPEHPDTARSLNNLASLYQSQGRYGEALPLHERALAIREKALGPEHPNTATSLGNLAGLYHSQGLLAKAEPLFERALVIHEKALGPEHPDTALGLNNLAFLYDKQGRYGEALPLYERALAISEKALGPEHPNIAISLGNLAGLHQSQGRYGEALPLYERALAISEKALGPEHPDTAISFDNLASLYHSQGLLAKSEALLRRTILIREKVLGPSHPDIANTLNNLAVVLEKRNLKFEAAKLRKRAAQIRQKHKRDQQTAKGSQQSPSPSQARFD